MARLDDIPTLPTNLELSGKDSFVIADKSFRGGTFAKQIPAAIISKYSHAFLLNFDSASVKVASQFANIDIKSFDGNQIIDSGLVVVTKPFVGLGSDSGAGVPKLNLGVHDLDSDGSVDNIVDSVVLNTLGASMFNQNQNEAAEGVVCPNGDNLRVTLGGGTTSSSAVNMNAATAGQVVILVNIIDVNDYTDLVPAFD